MVTSSNGSQRWLSRVASRLAKRPEAAGVGGAGRFLAPLLAAVSLWAGACSSSGAATDKFMGTWTFDSGTITGTTACMLPNPVDLKGETLTLVKGMTSDLVSTLQSAFGTCTLNLDVSGSVASAVAGQSCAFTVTTGLGPIMVTFSVSSWTVTTTDGMSMTTAATAIGQGLASSCTLTLSGAGTKHSGDAGAGG